MGGYLSARAATRPSASSSTSTLRSTMPSSTRGVDRTPPARGPAPPARCQCSQHASWGHCPAPSRPAPLPLQPTPCPANASTGCFIHPRGGQRQRGFATRGKLFREGIVPPVPLCLCGGAIPVYPRAGVTRAIGPRGKPRKASIAELSPLCGRRARPATASPITSSNAPALLPGDRSPPSPHLAKLRHPVGPHRIGRTHRAHQHNRFWWSARSGLSSEGRFLGGYRCRV